MTIEPGKYFEIAYQLFRVNPDGTETLVHEVTADDPDRAICGVTLGFVEALDEALVGKKAGDKFDFVAEPDKAFGPYSEEEIYTIPRERMTVDGKFDESMFTPGALIPLMTPCQGQGALCGRGYSRTRAVGRGARGFAGLRRWLRLR